MDDDISRRVDQILRSTTSRRAFLGGALSAGLLLAGCDSGAKKGGGGSTSGGSLAASPTTTAAAGGGGDTGAILRAGVPNDFLPPALLRFNPSNRPLRRTVFDVLLNREQDGTYTPSLAKSWEWNADKTSLVITLQDGVTFHSGKSFSADDVVYTLKTAAAPKSGVQVAKMLNRATDVKASGANQVTVTFDKPFASYLDALAMIPIVDSATFADAANGKQLIGTGPFVWKSWTPGSKAVMDRNDSYWQESKPYLGGIEFSILTQSQAMLAAMQSGGLDLAVDMLARDAATLQKDSKFTVTATPGVDVYVGCSTQLKPMDDVRVRQAVAYAIDRKRIATQVYSGFADPSCVVWPSETPGVTPDMVSHYTYDIDKAKSLLNEAGAVGAEIELAPSPQDPGFAAAADIVQYGLEQAGLKIKRVSITAADWPKRNQSYNLPQLWISWIALTVSGPVATLMAANPLTAGANTSHVDGQQYADLIGAELAASSPDAAKTAIADLTKYMLDQAFHNTMVQAQSPRVGVKRLSGLATDATLSLVVTDTKLST
jgi:peptide/nickel transport system substrate-binding protein